jgi:hypothetical protein
MFDIVTNLISERKIPALDELQMQALLHHLFTATPRDIRIHVAEVAYRYDCDHPRAMDVFLPLRCHWPNGPHARGRRRSLPIPPTCRLN